MYCDTESIVIQWYFIYLKFWQKKKGYFRVKQSAKMCLTVYLLEK